jgi:hypothetical protein
LRDGAGRPGFPLRQAAVAHARRLAQDYDDLVPLDRLREGFEFVGRRVSFGSFMKGIHRDRSRQRRSVGGRWRCANHQGRAPSCACRGRRLPRG